MQPLRGAVDALQMQPAPTPLLTSPGCVSTSIQASATCCLSVWTFRGQRKSHHTIQHLPPAAFVLLRHNSPYLYFLTVAFSLLACKHALGYFL